MANRPQNRDPFFIYYDSRSGSTLLANLLTKSCPVAITPETNFVTALLKRYRLGAIPTDAHLARVLDLTFSDPKFADLGLERALLAERLRVPLSLADYIRGVLDLYRERHVPVAARAGIKKNYIKHHDRLRQLFPEARFIALIRDGRAVFNSKKTSINSVTGRVFETNPLRAARRWRWNVERARDIERRGDPILVLHYEKLVQEPEETIAAACRFLGLEPVVGEAADARYAVPERYGTELHRNVDKAPMPERVEAWKKALPPEEIFAFETVAHAALTAEGYPLVHPVAEITNPWRRLRAQIKFLV